MVTLASLTLAACATTTAPVAPEAITPVSPALEQLVLQLIERVERESNCRYLLAGRTVAEGSPFVVVLLSYRGPEVECRQGLEQLNRDGAAQGLTFVAARLRLASAP